MEFFHVILISLTVFSLILAFTRITDHFLQLRFKNRLLMALRNLDVVALSTTDFDLLCQNIVDLIKQELGYFFGAIALIDYSSNGLKRIAISQDPSITQVLQNLSIDYKKQKAVPLSEMDNTQIQVINSKKLMFTPNLCDIQVGVQPKEISDKLQKMLGMKGFFVYPLLTKDKVIGVIYYCTLIPKNKLSKFEFEVMDEFTRDVSRVLDNALLYQNLRRTSEDLKKAYAQLQQLDKFKDDLLSVASHELRTPMTVIRSYLWMALHKSDVPLSEKLKKYLYRSMISTERLINLVNDMLNVSRIEAGRIEVNPTAFDMVDLCKQIMEDIIPKAEEKGITIHVLETPIPKVFADANKVEEVIMNLVGNCLKFTPFGGQIVIKFFTDGQVVDTSVVDNGTGISREDLGKLFAKFGRLDNSYVAMGTAGGSGLGLYISRKLVELMHGKIWANSEGLGKGTTFTFSLPIATADILAKADQYQVRSIGEAKSLEPVAI